MKRHGVTFTEEGGGVVATCLCTWLRWMPDRKAAEGAWNDHKPKPKKETTHG